jgi:DNA-binding MarR family transcriptional regulator
MTEQETKVLLNKILKQLFYKILRLQEKVVSKSTNAAVSRTEMHMLETIDDMPDATLTNVAEKLGITKATASVSAARLKRKNFIEKVKSDNDKRKNMLQLTEEGKVCCGKHRQFHEMMVESMLKDFKIDQYPEVLISFNNLYDFFSAFEE